MNILFSKIGITLVLTFFGQLSFGMNCSQELSPTFTCFSRLSPEMQVMTMEHSNNQANIQLVSKQWCVEKSIKCWYKKKPIKHERMVRILLNAVYVKNYDGVENILKNSKLKDHFLCHYIDTDFNGTKEVLDLHGIATYNEDKKMSDILKLYEISTLPEGYESCRPTKLMMACFAGNSHLIGGCSDVPLKEMTHSLAIAVDGDYGKCVNMLMKDMYFSSSSAELVMSCNRFKLLLTKDLLISACNGKKINALKELLETRYFLLNEVRNNQTLLDRFLEKEKKDFGYNAVVLLLQKYGAKTLEELTADTNDEEDVNAMLYVFGCTIF